VKDGKARSSVEQLAAQLAMHVAASDPQYVSRQTMPTEVVDAQRAAFESQVCSNDPETCSAL
jgi:translation elongation factor EF-Ts